MAEPKLGNPPPYPAPNAEQPQREPWHALSAEEVLRHLQVDPKVGLSPEEARKRLEKDGPNRLPEEPPPSFLSRLLAQFADVTVLTLLVAAFVSAGMAFFGGEEGNFLELFGDPLAIFAIVVLNAALGLTQESRAAKALAALKEMTSPLAHVRRGGQQMEIPSSDVVVGDIVVLGEGDAIPADVRLIESYDLSVAEAALTGESVPVAKRSSPPADKTAPLAERVTACYLGTNVIRGKGVGVVFATGARTELGHIAGMLARVETPTTPLQISLQRFGKIVVFACLAICALVFGVGILLGTAGISELFLVAVALAVAAIPEGLPAITTIALALGTQRMARRRALVRRLPAVETLGCSQVICSDKTGTLTSNAMAVRRLWAGGRQWKVTGGAHDLKGTFEEGGRVTPQDDPDLQKIFLTAGSTQGARVHIEGSNPPSFSGDPTDVALLVLGLKGGLDPAKLRVIDEQPFSSERLMTTTLVEEESGPVAYTRGAVERVLDVCVSVLEGGKERPLTEKDRQQILDVQGRWASDGMRIIGLAYRYQKPSDGAGAVAWEKEMIFLGLAGIIDPPRPEVLPAIAEAHEAGIRVVMITGDHPATARAISRELGMWDEEKDVILSGSEVDALSDEELEKILPRLRVVARATPANKLRVIEALARKGLVAAMTGDGVNDAPAVKAAPIGIAMGKTGTDVTKEAADLVLADDNFATIIAAVEEGRAIYANIRKFVFFLLSANAGLVFAIFFGSFLGWPVLLTPIQLLWINLITNGLPALALGVEPPDPDQMRQPPRNPSSPLLSKQEYIDLVMVGLMFAVIGLFAFLIGVVDHETSLTSETYWGKMWEAFLNMGSVSKEAGASGQSLAFAVLALGPIFHSFNCRSKTRSIFQMSWFSNPALWGAGLAAVALLGLALYVPFLEPIFKTHPPTLNEIIIGGLLCLLPLFFVEVAKLFLRRRERRGEAVS